MYVAIGPKQAEAGKNPDEGFEVAGLLNESTYAKFVRFLDLISRHSAGVHHNRDVLVHGMFLSLARTANPLRMGMR